MSANLPPDIAAQIEAEAEKEMRAAMPSMSNDELKYYLESPYERSLTFRACVNGAQRLYSLLLEKGRGTFDEKAANQAEKEVVALWNIDRFTREHIGFSFDEGARWQHSQDAAQIEVQQAEIEALKNQYDALSLKLSDHRRGYEYELQDKQMDIDDLETKLAEAEKALEFYATKAQTDDDEQFYAEHPLGARARIALVKIRENR